MYSAMVLLNGIAEQSKYLYKSLDDIQKKFGPSFYERIDIQFDSDQKKEKLENYILENIPTNICNYSVKNVVKIDGIKFRMNKNYWLLFRFSGTEPLLRLYCEASSPEILKETLKWSEDFINKAIF